MLFESDAIWLRSRCVCNGIWQCNATAFTYSEIGEKQRLIQFYFHFLFDNLDCLIKAVRFADDGQQFNDQNINL